ncbi:MAG: ATP-binding cassette domain-containing protein [Pyrinomonadaceae bacterium]|nr:ATP-binding cassette domain-containing protein [Pyrinomonadaceae bacterium]
MCLKLEKVSKRYLSGWVLRDLSFKVERGEVFGLIGEAGSGRSTTLKIIAGKVKDFSGKIFFENSSVKDIEILTSESKSKNTFLRKLLGIRRNDFVPIGKRKLAELEQILEKAKDVVLLDNPFMCLDESERQKAIELLRTTVKRKSLASIFVTNNHEEIFGACDRIGILHRGEIIQEGTPREVYEKPEYAISASLLGKCNLITARRVTFSKETPEFQTLEGNHRLKTDRVERQRLGAITRNTTLAVRPEHICISFGASFPEDNLLKAKVIKIDFRGEITRVLLDANGLKLEAAVLRLVGLDVGDECIIAIPPNRITILRD